MWSVERQYTGRETMREEKEQFSPVQKLGLDSFTSLAWVQSLVQEVLPQAAQHGREKKRKKEIETGQGQNSSWT